MVLDEGTVMDERQNVLRYHILVRILHWLMAIGILFMWCSGNAMKFLLDGGGERSLVLDLHILSGYSLIVLLGVRIILRLCVKPPPLPVSIPAYDQWNAKVGHFMLYAFMVIVMSSGFILAQEIVISAVERVEIENIHYILAMLFFVAVLIHIAAVIKHRWFEGEDIFYRMWFGRKP